MTEREKFEANQKREEIFRRDKYICRICGDPIRQKGAAQLAHRIAQTKNNIAKYGAAVIHHDDNLLSVCSLACNDSANIGFVTLEANQLADSIYQKIKDKL